MLLVGSYAAKLQQFDFGRQCADTDLVATYDELQEFHKANKDHIKASFPISDGNVQFVKMKDNSIVEIEIAWPGSRGHALLNWVDENHRDCTYVGLWFIGMSSVKVASLELLLLLKESHKYLKNSPHFYKTMADIKLLRKRGISIPEAWKSFLAEREKVTYTYSLPKLNVGNKEFFDSSVTGVHQVYDHDSIHEAVAILLHPAYKSYQPEDAEVMCSREMFENSHESLKFNGVVEEACVLAIERSLVPYPGGKTPDEAFKYALMKVCTSITSGWFREWAWEHHDEAIDWYETFGVSYWERFQQAVRLGKVKLKDQSQM